MLITVYVLFFVDVLCDSFSSFMASFENAESCNVVACVGRRIAAEKKKKKKAKRERERTLCDMSAYQLQFVISHHRDSVGRLVYVSMSNGQSIEMQSETRTTIY